MLFLTRNGYVLSVRGRMLVLPHQKKQHKKRLFLVPWRRKKLSVKLKIDARQHQFSICLDAEEKTPFFTQFDFFFLVHLTLMGPVVNNKEHTSVPKLRLEQKQTKSTLFFLLDKVRAKARQNTEKLTKQDKETNKQLLVSTRTRGKNLCHPTTFC